MTIASAPETTPAHAAFEVTLDSDEGFAQTVDFGNDLPGLLLDEPEPLGAGAGPDPARVLAARWADALARACSSACASLA